MPLTSNPDAFYLSKEDFFERFGFDKPSPSPTPSSFSETNSDPDTSSRIDSSASSPTSKTATSESPFTQTLKNREAHAGLNSEGDASGVDSAAINKEAMGGGGNREASGREGEGEGVEEVIFYCKAGVRSRAAARMAREWEGVGVGEMRGGWVEWEGRGGEVERGG